MSLSVEAVAVAKKYTDNSILGITGVLAGKNCKIKSITKSGDINTVVFEWTADDGTIKTSQMLVKDGIRRVRLTTDGSHIYDKDNILTFNQIKELVMDEDKFVTLTLDNNISFLPSAYDGSAIWFDSGFIEEGIPNQLRVIINDQNQVNLDQIELAKKSVVDTLQSFCKISAQSDNALIQSVDGLYVKKSQIEAYDDSEVKQLIQVNTADISSVDGKITNIQSDINEVSNEVADLELAVEEKADKDSVVYSTDEIVVGTWLGNKPIYRKVFELTDPSVFPKSSIFKVADLPTNFEMLIKGSAILKTYENSYTNNDILVYSTSNAIMCKQDFSGYAEKMWVVVEYTKTTD